MNFKKFLHNIDKLAIELTEHGYLYTDIQVHTGQIHGEQIIYMTVDNEIIRYIKMED